MSHIDATAPHTTEGRERLDSSDIDEVFEVLQDGRRRDVVEALSAEGERRFDDLVDAVVERERARSRVVPVEEPTDEVRAALFHNHLPRLDDAGLVVFDGASETVRVVDERAWALLDRLRVEAESVSRPE